MTTGRRYLLKAGAGVLVAGLTTQSARADFDRYVLDPGRGAFAWFESRDGKRRTWTGILACRAGGDGPDGTLKKPVVLLWTSSWNNRKSKLQRVAFGVADDGRCRVSAVSGLSTASVTGTIRVWDAVKGERSTLTIDLEWNENAGKRNLDFDETYSPDPDPLYTARFIARGEKRDAIASGEILRGNRNLTPKRSKDAFIGDFDSARVLFDWP